MNATSSITRKRIIACGPSGPDSRAGMCRPSRIIHLEGQNTGVSDRKKAPKRRPRYWFESRRYYFVSNHGWVTVLWWDMAWSMGFATFRVRQFIQTRKPHQDPPHFLLWDFVRFNFLSLRSGSYNRCELPAFKMAITRRRRIAGCAAARKLITGSFIRWMRSGVLWDGASASGGEPGCQAAHTRGRDSATLLAIAEPRQIFGIPRRITLKRHAGGGIIEALEEFGDTLAGSML